MKIISQVPMENGKLKIQFEGNSKETKPTGSFLAKSSSWIDENSGSVYTYNGTAWSLAKNGQMKDLPVVTATDNGKVLKVKDGVWSVGEDGGGGGAEKFIVTLTQDEQTEEWTADKTVTEIVAAREAGKIVVVQFDYIYFETSIPMQAELVFALNDGVQSVALFTSPFTLTPNKSSVFNIMGNGRVDGSSTEEWEVYLCQTGIPTGQKQGDILVWDEGDEAWKVESAPTTNAPLIVTMTYDSSTNNLVGDKTYKEIYDAFSSGQSVFCKGIVGSTNVTASVLAANESSEEVTLSVCVQGSIATPEGTATDYLTLHLGN